MTILYHLPFSSNCRLVRIALAEKKLEAKYIVEPIWERRKAFLKINPEGELPVVIDNEDNNIIGYFSLAYFLEESEDKKKLIGDNPLSRLEVLGNPSSEFLKAGRANLKNHENYFEWLLNNRTFLAGEFFSIADIIYATYLSTLDYLGEVDWGRISFTKKWYAKIKSRPSFRDILEEKIFTIPDKNFIVIHWINTSF